MAEIESEINIALSGWAGVGTSTLSLLLTKLLKRKYVNLGGVFRDLGSRLGFEEEGMDRPAADDYLESIIGKTIDKYVDFVLVNRQGLLLESDLSMFRLGKRREVVSVFLKAIMDVRLERIAYDRRAGGAEALVERDRVLREKYLELWTFDIFDEELIRMKYDLFLDTSHYSILEKVNAVLDFFEKDGRLDYIWSEVRAEVSIEVENYLRYGKADYREHLISNGYVMSAEEIEKDMCEIFAEDVQMYPEKVRSLFSSS